MSNTTIKHDFSTLSNGSNDIFTNAFNEVSNATFGLLGTGIILSIFIILFGIFMQRTQDIGKSFISSLHISLVLSIIIYYWGKTGGFTGIPDIIMLTLIIFYVAVIAFIKYNRSDQV